ncbi:hypothetical protein D3C71_1674570 [compost metagenome]
MPLAADGGVLRGPGASGGHHLNTVHGTGRHAQVAAGAPVGQHRVHVLVGAHDGIDGTGLDAQRTADAMRFIDAGDQQRTRFAALKIQRQGRGLQQRGQRGNALIPAGRAAVDGCRAFRDGLGIRPTTVIAALGTLRLRQQSVNTVRKQTRIH